MKKLFLSFLFILCLASGCTQEVVDADSDDSYPRIGQKQEPQSAGPCFPTNWSAVDNPTPTANVRKYEWKVMNIGTISCPYKTQVEVTKANGTVVPGSVFTSPGSLAPYNPTTSGPKHSYVQPLYAGDGTCTYKLWYKYKPFYPNGTEDWFYEGPYYCRG